MNIRDWFLLDVYSALDIKSIAFTEFMGSCLGRQLIALHYSVHIFFLINIVLRTEREDDGSMVA